MIIPDDKSFRRTKIVATLGPASSSPKKIKQLLEAGVNVVRLNMSHGDHDSHRVLMQRVRSAARRQNSHVAVMMDLCGPKIRTGKFRDGSIPLVRGETVTVTSRRVEGVPGLIPSQYKRIHKDLKKGERILLDDGKMELVVDTVRGENLRCTVVHGGTLSNNKGMNLPDSAVSAPSLTAKDKRDVELAIELEADYLALSFVRSGKDIVQLRRYMGARDANIPIVAKIEKPEAIDNIEDILHHSNALMVARGDLGIELPAEQVPLIQQRLVNLARTYDRPVIVATQMLESMVEQSRPTRAEVSDVAHASLAGADAVMLSGETAAGKNPIDAVRTMNRIVTEMESYQFARGHFGTARDDDTDIDRDPVRGAVAHAAAAMSTRLHMDAFIIPTSTGTTARVMSSERPLAPSLGVCSDPAICRRMALYWGVIPIRIPDTEVQSWDALCKVISRQCLLTAAGHTVLVVSGFRSESSESAPVLKILQL